MFGVYPVTEKALLEAAIQICQKHWNLRLTRVDCHSNSWIMFYQWFGCSKEIPKFQLFSAVLAGFGRSLLIWIIWTSNCTPLPPQKKYDQQQPLSGCGPSIGFECLWSPQLFDVPERELKTRRAPRRFLSSLTMQKAYASTDGEKPAETRPTSMNLLVFYPELFLRGFSRVLALFFQGQSLEIAINCVGGWLRVPSDSLIDQWAGTLQKLDNCSG